ncbi:M61 family metallopeptidase [Flammeovirga pacifica]|uniref:M61 family metallopeptidase n=1 Tax=Flammeovirga pacifica TaxID=915059 RepID=UPI0013012194|nr:peptidase M61 [Flammeovirga pacifica]
MKYYQFFCLYLFLSIQINVFGQDHFSYLYHLDLNNVTDDQIKVELNLTTSLKEDKVIFQFPAIVPGTYKIYDFGRFIDQFSAQTKSGDELPVKKIDKNRWEISNATSLHKISYSVDDTWDTRLPQKVFEPAGTNIEKDNNFVLNNHGFFGFFDQKIDYPFQIKIKKNKTLYGSTSLKKEFTSDTLDHYIVPNYHRLVDNPIMYAQPDTASIQVGDTQVFIGLHSPNKKINASLVIEKLEDVLIAQEAFLKGKLPTDRYTFIIYLTDEPGISGAMGALEHWNSSFYFLPYGSPNRILRIIQDIAAHEFFHIITPLSIHSEEIANFDYMEPKMSEHLWLYEGVTEYFAGLALVQQNVIERETYLNALNKKILSTIKLYDRDLSFTEMSKGCLDEHGDQYPNVYEKGALIALGLDIVLLENSNGQQDLRDLMITLSEKFGSDKSFKDKDLFDIIGKVSGIPETTAYLNKYVGDNNRLPLEEIFQKVGIDYAEKRVTPTGTFGNIGISMNDQEELFIEDISDMDVFGLKMGFQVGDVLLKYNDTDLTVENITDILDSVINSPKKNTKIKVTVRRQGKIVKLKTKTIINHQIEENIFELNDNCSKEELRLRELWLGKTTDEE